MAFRIQMPQLSSEVEAATLVSWLVAPGDVVEKGDVIAELETDKATVELEAPASGTIAELIVAAGSEGIEPGAVLGTIEVAEGDSERAPVEQAAPPPAASRDKMASESQGPIEGDVLRVSTPLARRAAAERGLDLEELEGSGLRGRVVEADVLRASGGAPERAEAAEAGSAEIESPSPARPEPAAASSDERVGGAVEVAAPASSAPSLPEVAAPASSAPSLPEVAAPFEARRLSAMRKT
ncbi:MAG: E3 binding domain-containing protein, partial [Deltaproteobacteria bacterium]|nr:E3 binding domain-containing protein [Deltaproteobacteria bacterium]